MGQEMMGQEAMGQEVVGQEVVGQEVMGQIDGCRSSRRSGGCLTWLVGQPSNVRR